MEERRKKALITGGTKGIGREIVRRLLEENYICHAGWNRDEAAYQTMKQETEEKYGVGKCLFFRADLSDLAETERFCEKILRGGAKLDILVLNAGATVRRSLCDMEYGDWEYVMNVNLNIPFEIVRRLQGQLNEGGRIIFISSVLGRYPHAASLPYNVSKAGVAYLAKALVKEFADRGITVNSVSAGFCNTPWQLEKSAGQRSRIEEKIALHRFAEPGEIADVVMGIVHNGYINGSDIAVDGGYCYR